MSFRRVAKMPKNNDSKIEVADIFREHIRDYLEIYNMPYHYYDVVSDINGCRSKWLGGHILKCSQCGKEVPVSGLLT